MTSIEQGDGKLRAKPPPKFQAKHHWRAATLAVGTELADGQVTDRNSGWISKKVTKAGIQVIEHRTVADDHHDIARALTELAHRVDLLFVTGGLGPTSDDFTRDVISQTFHKPLKFDDVSWAYLEETLRSRGIVVREIQKQQCFFPEGSRVLKNPAGTANAFMFETQVVDQEVHQEIDLKNDRKNDQNVNQNGVQKRVLKVYVLPGPPSEIAAIWDLNLGNEIAALVPEADRESLAILRCLGRPESEVAEKTEAAIAGSGIRVGYRAHLPYVEVKLWISAGRRSELEAVVASVDSALGDWVVTRGIEDLADHFFSSMRFLTETAGRPVRICDYATSGWLSERLIAKARKLKLKDSEIPFSIETIFQEHAPLGPPLAESPRTLGASATSTAGAQMTILIDEKLGGWKILLKRAGIPDSELELVAPKHYNLRSERARKYATEMIFFKLKSHLPS